MTSAPRILRSGKSRLLSGLRSEGPAPKTRAPHPGGRPIANAAVSAASKGLAKHGLGHADLLAVWPDVVGPELAKSCRPQTVTRRRGDKGATLTLRVWGAAALRLQHQENVILDRVNRHFGAGAVTKLALVQGPPPRAAAKPGPAAMPNAVAEAKLQRNLSHVPAGPLRDALHGLGLSVLSASGPRKRN